MIGLIATSAKHGHRGEPNSAIEELIHALEAELSRQSLANDFFSFREEHMPLPDGRPLQVSTSSACQELSRLVTDNNFLVLGLTAYMGHISASSKTFFEYIRGADYDSIYPEVIPEADKSAAMIVIGTDPLTTANGAAEAADLRARLGWRGWPVIEVNNPRLNPIDYSDVSFLVFSQLSAWLDTRMSRE